MHVITSQDPWLLMATPRGCVAKERGEEMGPPIRTAADEDEEKKEQLTARGEEKQELWRGSGPSCAFCAEDGSRTPSAQMLPPRFPLQTSFPSPVLAPIMLHVLHALQIPQ